MKTNRLFSLLAIAALLFATCLAPNCAAASPTTIPTTSGGSWKLLDLANAQAYLYNYSTASQAPVATVRTYIVGSNINIPTGGLKVGTVFRWRFNMTKTGAGTATSTIDIAIGTAGTTADTAVVAFTKPAGTGVIDEGWVEVDCVIRGPITALCIAAGEFTMTHNLAATGHAQIPVVVVNTISSGFDATVGNLVAGLCITTGASDAITIQMVTANAVGL